MSVVASKPVGSAADLAVAYSPGVAEPCIEIHKDPDKVYEYTARGHLVGVITNGTAVLGLGNIGPAAAKPVMEGKAVLFKHFADLDAFDIEVNELDPARFVDVICALGPTFGGINLEDIRVPECFFIEDACRQRLDIPVFHDDQHGTAIIAGAGLLNGLDLVGKRPKDVRVVFSGAGMPGSCCAKYFLLLGVRRENLILTDVKGVVYRGRGDGNYLDELAADTTARTLAEAIAGADVFAGLSAPNLLSPDMLRTMARDPIVFALANPIPEIDYRLAHADSRRRSHGHRPQRLPESDQQRHRFSLYIPGRARCAGTDDQRGHEARCHARHCRPCQGADHRGGRPGEVRPYLWPRILHPEAVRPPAAHPSCDGRGAGRDGNRRRPAAPGPGSL